jgi:hypothetical protein
VTAFYTSTPQRWIHLWIMAVMLFRPPTVPHSGTAGRVETSTESLSGTI